MTSLLLLAGWTVSVVIFKFKLCISVCFWCLFLFLLYYCCCSDECTCLDINLGIISDFSFNGSRRKKILIGFKQSTKTQISLSIRDVVSFPLFQYQSDSNINIVKYYLALLAHRIQVRDRSPWATCLEFLTP